MRLFILKKSRKYDRISITSNRYQYLKINRHTSETDKGLVSLFQPLGPYEFLSYNEGDFDVIISNFGEQEYRCVGICYCTENSGYVRRTTSIIPRSMYYLLTALTSVVAYSKAKDYFQNQCKQELNSFCMEHKIHSEVESCESFSDDDDEGGSCSYGTTTLERPKNYFCRGSCVPKEFRTPHMVDLAESYHCENLRSEGTVHLSDSILLSSSSSEELELAAVDVYNEETMKSFCEEQTSNHMLSSWSSDENAEHEKLEGVLLPVPEVSPYERDDEGNYEHQYQDLEAFSPCQSSVEKIVCFDTSNMLPTLSTQDPKKGRHQQFMHFLQGGYYSFEEDEEMEKEDTVIPHHHVVEVDISLDSSKDLPSLTEDIENLLHLVFPNLISSTYNIEIRQVKGGCSNILYLTKFVVIEPHNNNRERYVKYLVRVNGDTTDSLVSRDKEFSILSQIGVVICRFKNGLIYPFKEGRALSNRELGSRYHQKGIAHTLSKLHSEEVMLPIEGINKMSPAPPSLFVDLDNWYEDLLTKDNERLIQLVMEEIELYYDARISEREVRDIVNFKRVGEEIQFIKNVFEEHFMDTIVFCHNDLTSGNIIYDSETNEHSLIDFEYSGHNFRGFDLGDHFGEYSGLQLEDPRPSDESMKYFLKEYLRYDTDHYDHLDDDEDNVSVREVEKLFIESYTGMCASHLWTILWTWIQTLGDQQVSDDFNYALYGLKRFKMYLEDKKKLMKMLKEFDFFR